MSCLINAKYCPGAETILMWVKRLTEHIPKPHMRQFGKFLNISWQGSGGRESLHHMLSQISQRAAHWLSLRRASPLYILLHISALRIFHRLDTTLCLCLARRQHNVLKWAGFGRHSLTKVVQKNCENLVLQFSFCRHKLQRPAFQSDPSLAICANVGSTSHWTSDFQRFQAAWRVQQSQSSKMVATMKSTFRGLWIKIYMILLQVSTMMCNSADTLSFDF